MRRSENIQGRLAQVMIVLAAIIVPLVVMPATASAMYVSAAPHVLEWVDVKVYLPATDPTGVAVLVVDGKVQRTADAAKRASRSIAFSGVKLAPGVHTVEVMLRSRDKVLKQAPKTVTAWRRPAAPSMVSPAANGFVGQSASVLAHVGLDTTRLTLRVNGRDRRTINVQGGWTVIAGTGEFAYGDNTIELIASNPAARTSTSYRVRRSSWPWPTCIIVDKSEYRLYWVRDGVLVRTYPVAIGKSGTPTPERTWRVGEKLYESMGGVFGPRRLRLYSQTGPSSFSYTGYGIHGTNQEWVIGTMASHGCIRMYNRDILDLWPQVPLHTMVQTRY